MCYSNSNTSQLQAFKERYKREIAQPELYQPVFFANGFDLPQWPIVTSDSTVKWMQWGLIPHWFAQDDAGNFARKTLNARVETIQEKPSFRASIVSKRCLIPSTGFFEFQTNGTQKKPFFIHLPTNELFSIAGVYDQWIDLKTGVMHESFSMITCRANPLMETIHNSKKRMPALLNRTNEETWLTKGTLNLITPYSGELIADPIDKRHLRNTPKAQELFISDQQLPLF